MEPLLPDLRISIVDNVTIPIVEDQLFACATLRRVKIIMKKNIPLRIIADNNIEPITLGRVDSISLLVDDTLSESEESLPLH